MQQDRTLTLLLIRHGETIWNAENRWQGQRDIPLSAIGREQARRLCFRLASDWQRGVLPGPPDAVFCSDLSRAVETAALLHDALPFTMPLQQLPELRERNFGQWEGLTAAEVRERFGDAPYAPDAEQYEQVAVRMDAALVHIWQETLEKPQQTRATALVVGHGGSLRMLLVRALGVGTEAARRFRLGNTGISWVVFEGPELEQAQGTLVMANNLAHL